MRMSRQRTHLNGVPETVRKGTLCVDRARQSSLVLAGTECGHVFITDLRLSTVLRTKSSTEEDDKDRQLEENKEERKQQKWRFKGDEIGACLFDAKDPERYVYFARNAVLNCTTDVKQQILPRTTNNNKQNQR